MVAEITVNNTEEFQELVDNKDIRRKFTLLY